MNDDQLRPAGGEDRSVPGVDAEVVVVDSRDGGLLLPSPPSPLSHVAVATVTVCSRLTTHNVVSSATPHLAAHRRPVTATTASVAAVGEGGREAGWGQDI